jgi:hypothetical protein
LGEGVDKGRVVERRGISIGKIVREVIPVESWRYGKLPLQIKLSKSTGAAEFDTDLERTPREGAENII